MTVKAIETTWRGYRFRSRLEARWAVFFDAAGIRWEYEPEGFTIGCYEGHERPWLPDFKVTFPNGTWYWVEVKGDPDYFSTEKGKWFWHNIDFGGGPPGFPNCGDLPDMRGGILFLGGLPPEAGGYLIACLICHHKGVWWTPVAIGDNGSSPDIDLDPRSIDSTAPADFQPQARGRHSVSRITRAVNAAKSARFEHGESPQ